MRILITGGAGYIGSVATEVLVKEGHDIAVFDNLQQGHREAVSSGARLVIRDLSKSASIESALSSFHPEAVMHFAANSLVGESMKEPFRYLGDNVVNALNLLNAMEQLEVRKILLSSTANLFADPESVTIIETERITPGSPYGESKYVVERQLYWLAITRGWRYACLRYFNAAGTTVDHGEDHNPEFHLIPLVLQVADGRRERISIFGIDYPTHDGTCVRDYVHVEDLIDAHIRALAPLEFGNCTYNMGNGRGFSVLEVVQAARNVTGYHIPVDFASRRPGDPAILIASSDKIQKELGWRPRYSIIESIVATAWQWHKAHPNAYNGSSRSL